MRKLIILAVIVILAVVFTPKSQELQEETICVAETTIEEVVIEEVETWVFPLTDEEYELIYHTILGEVGNAKEVETMELVAECIYNRVVLKGYGDTVTKVITAPHQFDGYNPNTPSEEIDEMINEAIESVFKYGKQHFEEPILHFHASYVTPSWASEFKLLAELEGTKFYT